METQGDKQALVDYVELAQQDKEEGKVMSSESFKDKLKKRKESLK